MYSETDYPGKDCRGVDESPRMIDALYKISQSMTVRFGQRKLLQDITASIERELGLKRCTIMLLSADGEELIFEADSTITLPESGKISYHMGEGVTGRVLETGQPAIIPLIADEPDFRGRIHKRPSKETETAGFICLPISIGPLVVGTLAADVPANAQIPIMEAYRLLSVVACMIAHDVQLRRDAHQRYDMLEKENRDLRNRFENLQRPENIIGNSHVMQDVFRRIFQVAPSETTVLIRGESGTGKELVASAIHYSGNRAGKPFVKINCAALSENLLESELFGHEKGAFTGAMHTRIGLIEEAQGGTLFLDEIGDISPLMQAKLLRVLQEHEFQRVGSNKVISADIRIITATNRNLEAAIEQNLFRQDLYFRINVFPIHVPPLREHKEDIMALADHFALKFAKKMGKTISRISTNAINMMYTYHWPGNIRELENCIECAVLLCKDNVIHSYDLPPTLQTPETADTETSDILTRRVEMFERDLIIEEIKRNDGNITAASRKLGITFRMMRYKIAKLGINYKLYIPEKT